MTHGTTYYPTKSVCIYCKASNVLLSNEHIVPYALGGQHVIRSASCSVCADITKRFEQKVARDMWGDARTSFNAPSRRKNKRKDFILMSDPENPNNKIKIPASEYPAGLVFYKMDPPGLLQGLTENVDISQSWKLIMINDDSRRKKFLRKYTHKLVLSFRNVPHEFGQLLCKIAYGQLLTTLDLNDFNPICLPYIMGEKNNVSYVVGGITYEVSPLFGIGYSLNTSALVFANRMLLIVNIRLYANTYAPEYQVVAGEVIGEKNIPLILQKIGPGDLIP